MNRHLTAAEALDLGRIHVHADHVIAGVREAGAGDETHVAGAENGHAHELSYPKGRPRAAQAQPRALAALELRRADSGPGRVWRPPRGDRKSTRLNSSHSQISYAVFCLKQKNHVQ